LRAETVDEFRKTVEQAAALERRFQPILVGEPSVEDTIAILRGLKPRYETHHGVRITDSALVSAAVLSDRYISDRFFPDKAIDLIDATASRLRIENDSMPAELYANRPPGNLPPVTNPSAAQGKGFGVEAATGQGREGAGGASGAQYGADREVGIGKGRD